MLDDGRLDLVIVDDLPLWRVLARLPAFFRGTLQPGGGADDGAVHLVAADRDARPWELHLDGEPRAGSGALEVQAAPAGADRGAAAGLDHASGL